MRYITRIAGSTFMLIANGKIKKKYNIINERQELHDELKKWTNAIGNKQFLHGNEITMPDIVVFGVLRSIKGMSTFNEILKENEVLNNWYYRVDKIIKSHSHQNAINN